MFCPFRFALSTWVNSFERCWVRLVDREHLGQESTKAGAERKQQGPLITDRCGRAQAILCGTTSGQEVLHCLRKQAKQAVKKKPYFNLCLSFYLQVPSLHEFMADTLETEQTPFALVVRFLRKHCGILNITVIWSLSYQNGLSWSSSL